MAKTNVLFMQSQSFFGSDSMIHSLIMRHLDRQQFSVHVACHRGTKNAPSAALTALSEIPDLYVRPTRFGPTLTGLDTRERLEEVARTASDAFDLVGLVRYARANKIDIIHGTEKPRDSYYGERLARLCGARSITHLHVKAEDWIRPVVRRAMGRNSAIIGVSQFVVDSAVALGYARSKVHAVLNAIDRSKWDDTTDGNPIRREFGVAPETPLISIISRLFTWKGHEILLDAAALLRARDVDFRLLIVGEDDPRATVGGGSFMARLRELTAKYQLDDRVTFAGFRTDVTAILAATDIYAMPTYEEPCAVAFLEAMAMRKPVVALRSGGTPELVDHGGSGLLSEPGDRDGLADNLRFFIENERARKSFGAAARQRVEQKFYPERLAEDVADIYRSLRS